MIEYRGYRANNIQFEHTHVVQKLYNNVPQNLYLRLDLANHSPSGFSWGYLGSGCSQLALALIADATEDSKLALKYYQEFKKEFVSKFKEAWYLTDKEIKAWIYSKEYSEII